MIMQNRGQCGHQTHARSLVKCGIIPVGACVLTVLDTGWFGWYFYRGRLRAKEHVGSCNPLYLSPVELPEAYCRNTAPEQTDTAFDRRASASCRIGPPPGQTGD